MIYIKISVLALVLATIGVLPTFAQQDIPQDLVISMNRSSCFGWCLAYSLTITADGSFTIVPNRQPAPNQKPIDPIRGKVSPEKVNELLAAFRKIKFYSLRKRYGAAGKGKTGVRCPEYSTDSATARVSISEKGKLKTVSHYLGCKGAKILDDLEALEDKIDEMINTRQWESQLRTGVADVIELKLEIHPTKQPLPTRPE